MSLLDRFNRANKLGNKKFYIYPQNDDGTLNFNAAITFDSLNSLGFTNKVNIAYEPLEAGGFSSDSIQGTPYSLMIVGIRAPVASRVGYTNQDFIYEIRDTLKSIDEYMKNTTFLTILQERPVFDEYSDIKITSYNYDINPESNILKCYMTLQEIRLTETQYGALPQNKVSNPANASTIDNGNVSAKAVA